MTSSLLEKEKEFHKLNDELEQQTKVLMNEVDTVMKMQNCIANQNKQNEINTKYFDNTNKTLESDNAWEKYEENQSIGYSIGLSKCLKTKILTLQNELDDLKTLYKNKCSEVKQLHTDFTKLEEEKTKLNQISNSHKDQKEKLSNQIITLNSKLQTKEMELSSMRKENESLKKEVKNSNMNTSTNETKLNKVLEENEKLKLNYKTAKQEDKDVRDNHKKQISDLTHTNKRLEKQVSELTNGFKKQMMLIDNLKKQKMYLESAKLIQVTEDEFSRILNWKPSE